ncbi:MAG: fumarate/nitrate reduction transcriptional regulator Fnr [Gammaproteobacteria bacterium]|nr:fumarate/nitrate reduction transcriptional regulator Fnr [Gammaproteobacteria bacterium]
MRNAVAAKRVVIDSQFVEPSNRRAHFGNVERCPTLCSSCNLKEMCLPCGMKSAGSKVLDDLFYNRRTVKRGASLYRAGMPFDSLFTVRSGFFKSYAVTEDGREQVTGFQMAGEIVGLDGIETDSHNVNVEALEDSVVCVIPFAQLEELASRVPSLQHQLHRMMSREIVRDQGVMMLLGSMHAEERVTAFLLNLSQRFSARGYASAEFMLRMTREEIGSYLGLKLETVSRIFSKLQQSGLIGLDKKCVRLLDLAALRAILGRTCQPLRQIDIHNHDNIKAVRA